MFQANKAFLEHFPKGHERMSLIDETPCGDTRTLLQQQSEQKHCFKMADADTLLHGTGERMALHPCCPGNNMNGEGTLTRIIWFLLPSPEASFYILVGCQITISKPRQSLPAQTTPPRIYFRKPRVQRRNDSCVP